MSEEDAGCRIDFAPASHRINYARSEMPSSTATTRKREIWSVVVIIVLVGLWYAFRAEKLFINKTGE
jgi:hypothetical protein